MRSNLLNSMARTGVNSCQTSCSSTILLSDVALWIAWSRKWKYNKHDHIQYFANITVS